MLHSSRRAMLIPSVICSKETYLKQVFLESNKININSNRH
ncbi:hypothetical protein ACPOL_7002 (plasmid) [Acidisarcina polymorpha]|uniref:Uncharacterized protein n=1 Tax=Acidisarcina polymorpha TaxID=2211140 RepID=A0A2Z5GBV6_9BACT|nr:hypothetical protein ACPOL_7002 [Acidisarcina polymorpha]